jgi:MFS superfamily sulfate permease-like transporter
VVIAMSQTGGVLGLKADLGHTFFEKVVGVATHLGSINPYAVIIALVTFAVTWGLLRVSKYIPAPLLALGVSTVLAATVWADAGLVLIRDKYGAIPVNLLQFTPPGALEVTPGLLANMAYYVAAIVFVSGIESLLCSRMADRLADNRGMPYDPNKELWGQGLVQIIVVFLNGFPHTGALARTATNIKVGAMSPLAGIFKFVFKLAMAAYLASWLEIVPMACVGGILMFVAFNMVKPAEVAAVWRLGWVHAAFMVYTAVMVAVTDFLVGVLTAMVLHAVLSRVAPTWTNKPALQLEHG